MNLMINGEPQIADSETLGALLLELGYTADAVATAVNGEFVAMTTRDDYPLQANDAVEIIAPMAGG